MLEVQTKAKRQIEILGLAIQNSIGLKDTDFAVIFDRDVPTIKRDMQELRSFGIDVHSERAKGICLTNRLEPRILRELILQYLGICNSASGVDKATTILVKQLKEKSLSQLVMLQRCIDGNTIAVIDYQKDDKDLERAREIQPLLIFNSERYWRVLAVNGGRIKQYILNKIVDVRPTTRRFKKIPQEQIDGMFEHSFKSWIGTDKFTVKIRLSKVWADRLKPGTMMETEEITENSDGSVEFSTTVNSLEEVAGWVVSKGGGATVLDPPRLKEMVVTLAKGVLGNYA